MDVYNPPAFPLEYRGADWVMHVNSGMSLRDWFAGMALGCKHVTQYVNTPEEMARLSYVIADAMLKAREVQP
jgi:hypothetical protein